MKRLLIFCLAIIICLPIFSSCSQDKAEGLSIVATNFPAYDFAKNIVGDCGTVTLLLPPGSESHTYEPTARDILKISGCDLFIYNGGESDTWVSSVLSSLEKKPAALKMMDCVDLSGIEPKDEHDSHSEHSGHGHEIDELIWTSPVFAADIVRAVSDKICRIDSENSDYYTENADDYIGEIKALDSDFRTLFENSERDVFVVADRFPFVYFANEYNLRYFAAYHSCSEDAEPTPAVIAELIDAVKNENIPVIFYIEFSNKTVAKAVSEDTGAAMLELNSCHNITKAQLQNGVTYVDLMRNNLEALKEAFN